MLEHVLIGKVRTLCRIMLKADAGEPVPAGGLTAPSGYLSSKMTVGTLASNRHCADRQSLKRRKSPLAA
jgi:hypothetical protein